LLYGSETWTIKARDARRITVAEMKYMRITAGYIWTDYKTNAQIAKEWKMTPILDKLLEYKSNWIQYVNRMPRNRLPRVMKRYSPTGRRNHGRPLKRLLDTRDRNVSTSGPSPWQIYDDDDDDQLDTQFLVHSHKLHKIKFLYMFRAQSAYHQEVNEANCTYAASGIVTLCKWPSCPTAMEGLSPSLAVAQDGHLQRVTIPEAAYVQFALLTSW